MPWVKQLKRYLQGCLPTGWCPGPKEIAQQKVSWLPVFCVLLQCTAAVQGHMPQTFPNFQPLTHNVVALFLHPSKQQQAPVGSCRFIYSLFPMEL